VFARQRVVDHLQRDASLGEAGCFGDLHVDEQAVPVLHERVTAETELGFLAIALARELRFLIRRGLVSLVAALLAMEVDRGVARVVARRLVRAAILWLEALERRPSFDEGAVDGEVLGAEQMRAACSQKSRSLRTV